MRGANKQELDNVSTEQLYIVVVLDLNRKFVNATPRTAAPERRRRPSVAPARGEIPPSPRPWDRTLCIEVVRVRPAGVCKAPAA